MTAEDCVRWHLVDHPRCGETGACRSYDELESVAAAEEREITTLQNRWPA